jgi:hypothetical protein
MEPSNIENEECCVCTELLEDSKPFTCGHIIHASCVVKSGKSKCPICRADIALSPEDEAERVKVEEEHKLQQEQEDVEHILLNENVTSGIVLFAEIITQQIEEQIAMVHAIDDFLRTQERRRW